MQFVEIYGCAIEVASNSVCAIMHAYFGLRLRLSLQMADPCKRVNKSTHKMVTAGKQLMTSLEKQITHVFIVF